MASQYTHDVVATTGEYTNKSGDKKKNYTNVGKAFTDDQGRISIKMASIPVGPDWSGWLSLYPAKEKDQGGYREPLGVRSPEYGKPDAHNQAKANGYLPQRRTDQGGAGVPTAGGHSDHEDFDDQSDIPFR